MNIRTSQIFPSTPEQLWPLLTNSTMDVPGCFCLGLPRPVACELPDHKGGVGSERRCISDRGVVIQKITTWEPPAHLRFRMVATDHCWHSHIGTLEEDFVLQPCREGTRLTRTTRLVANGPLRFIKESGFYLGLKRVHLYVFRNWRKKVGSPEIA